VRNYWRPSIDSFRAGFVVTNERTNERTNEPAGERTSGCQRLGIFPRQVSLGHPYWVDTTKAGQRRVFDCASRVLQSELTSAAGARIFRRVKKGPSPSLSLSLSLCVPREKKSPLRERPRIFAERSMATEANERLDSYTRCKGVESIARST